VARGAWRDRRGVGRRIVLVAALAATAAAEVSASAPVPGTSEWSHDHSRAGVPDRPDGLAQLNRMFGDRCGDRSNDARSYWPHRSHHGGGYIYYNTYIARDVGYNVRNHIDAAHRVQALYPGIGGYNCRLIAGSTSWSVHSWGAAIDTNWERNPRGQRHWNGRGSDGEDYYRYLPDVWRGAFPGHGFYWGLNFSTTPDPMHFQYVTNY
jgi:hypothetical protein